MKLTAADMRRAERAWSKMVFMREGTTDPLVKKVREKGGRATGSTMTSRALAVMLLMLALSSCVNNPKVSVTRPDGTNITLSTGSNLMAEVDEQVSEVRGGGFVLKHMVKRQDATRVPIAGINTLGIYGAGWLQAGVNKAKEVTKQIANTNASNQVINGQNTAAATAAGTTAAKVSTTNKSIDAGAPLGPVNVNPP